MKVRYEYHPVFSLPLQTIGNFFAAFLGPDEPGTLKAESMFVLEASKRGLFELCPARVRGED
jgi:hypothetical protein